MIPAGVRVNTAVNSFKVIVTMGSFVFQQKDIQKKYLTIAIWVLHHVFFFSKAAAVGLRKPIKWCILICQGGRTLFSLEKSVEKEVKMEPEMCDMTVPKEGEEITSAKAI